MTTIPATLSATQPSVPCLTPTTMGDAIKLAEMMSGANLVPDALKKKPSDCLMVIEQAMRWGMSPFAVAQSVSVISGKLMFEGKLVAAVVNANGNLSERLFYEYEGTGDNRTITVRGKIRNETAPRDVKVRMGDVKTSNKCWTSQPDQQLMYHGARVWARRHMPELMLGVYSPEEFEVADTYTGQAIDQAPQPAPSSAPAKPSDESAKLIEEAKQYADEIDLADSKDKIDALRSRYATFMPKLFERLPKWHERLMQKLEAAESALPTAQLPANDEDPGRFLNAG